MFALSLVIVILIGLFYPIFTAYAAKRSLNGRPFGPIVDGLAVASIDEFKEKYFWYGTGATMSVRLRLCVCVAGRNNRCSLFGGCVCVCYTNGKNYLLC